MTVCCVARVAGFDVAGVSTLEVLCNGECVSILDTLIQSLVDMPV